jgi:TonB-linked SusC/RagA family outer membrane protein
MRLPASTLSGGPSVLDVGIVGLYRLARTTPPMASVLSSAIPMWRCGLLARATALCRKTVGCTPLAGGETVMRLCRWSLLAGTVLAFSVPVGGPLHAQATITGVVSAKSTNAPLGQARVMAVGTTSATMTSEDGRYTLRNVRAGAIQLQVFRVGYTSKKVSTNVAAGEAVTQNFELDDAAIELQEVVITGTGAQRRQELGNSVTTFGNVSKAVEQGATNTFSDLMQSKAPGVIILPPTTLGGPPTLRIRGVSSISLSNAPIVYVDGVRYSTNTLTSGTDTPFSLLNMMNSEEIEDIEVVKGPSAATLYGTNAANGVVLITTKKGRAGSARWGYSVEQGLVKDRSPYPDMYAAWGHSPTAPATNIRCQLATQTPTTCITDSLTRYNYLRDAENTFIGNGSRQLYGMNVTGGNEQLRYYLSGDTEDEIGIVKMPGYEVQRFQTGLIDVRDEWTRPLAQKRSSFRGNFGAALSPKVDVEVSTGFTTLYNRQPPGDDLIIALLYVGIQNYGFKGPGLDKIVNQADGTPLHDAFTFAPGDVMQNLNESRVQRFTGSTRAGWRPFTWMQNEGTVGVDLAITNFYQICKLNECPPANATARQGRVTDNKLNRRNVSAKLASNSTWNWRPWATLTTSVGSDYTVISNDFVNTNGVTLPPGASTVAAATTRTASQQQMVAEKTLGAYIQEQAALNDRLFLTGALRTDQNSAFGTNFQQVVYPKVSLSWILSDEPFLNTRAAPVWRVVNSFRLRTAYGASGVQPGRLDALSIFTPAAVSIASRTATTGTDTPSLVENQPANPNLKPERSAELEMGFESEVLNRRLRIDYTYYNKKTHDALVQVNLAGSTGLPQLNPLQNIGSTQSWGHEAQLTAQLWDSRQVAWDMTLSASHNSNKIVDLGIDKTTGQPRFLRTGSGSTSGEARQVPGLPINAQFYRDYTYADANGDGVLQVSEVQVDSAFSYIGYRVPRDLISIFTGVDLLSRTLRFQALFDHKGGAGALDGANNFQCNTNPFACRESQDPTAPLWMQARTIAKFYGTNVGGTTFKTARGYFMSNAFWKFRELSAVYSIPQRARARVRAREGSTIVLSARNLKTWTKWAGIDPEANYGLTQTEFQNEFQSFGAPTYYTVRLNLKY